MSPRSAPRYTQAPEVSVNGSPLPAEWAAEIVGLVLELELQVPARLTIRLREPGPGRSLPALPFALGDRVTVKFPSPDGGAGETFHTLAQSLEVTEVGAERDDGETPEFVIVSQDLSHRLTHRHNVTTFLDMTASDVVAKVVAEVGLKVNAQHTSEKYPYLMQTDTTFGFVTTLARRCGFDWWVEGETFHFAPPPNNPPEVEVFLYDDLFHFSARASTAPKRAVEVRGWDPQRKKEFAGKAKPKDAVSTSLPGTNGSAHDKNTDLITAEFTPNTQSEADQLAAALAARQAAASVVADGETVGNPAIRPGVVVKVVDDHLGGRYPITRCDHRYTANGYTTRFHSGDREPHGLADLLSKGENRAGQAGFTGLPALMPAIVTRIGTDENLGRVKVKFPYLSDDDESHWARVLSAGGGPERGFWFLPEVNDEVLVAFEGDDFRYPVVMGGLYGKVNSPEKDLVDNGQIASRSVRSRLGHHIELFDGTGPETRHILFGLGEGGKAGKDYKVRLGEDRFDIEVPSGKPIAIKAGSSQITFTSGGAIEITADDIKLKANKTLSLEAGQTVTVKGNQGVSLAQGGNKVALGPAGAEVKGAPMTTIKGGPNVSIG